MKQPHLKVLLLWPSLRIIAVPFKKALKYSITTFVEFDPKPNEDGSNQSNHFLENPSISSDTLRRISRATTTALGELVDEDQDFVDISKKATPQFSHRIVVAIDFGTTYR